MKAVALATSAVLHAIGEDPQREGLSKTPARVARFWHEWKTTPRPVLTQFDADGVDELVLQVGIPVYSVCEHHLVPFFGTAVVGYIPSDRIVGLSKLARLVRYHASRPQNQERLTKQVADDLAASIAPRGVGVVLRCRHLCMEMRGVRVPGAETVTSRLVGVLRDDARARSEFLTLAGGRP